MALFLALMVLSGAPPRAKHAVPFETRCGWLDNPTPGNFIFHDRDGAWTLAVQGGYEAKGFDDLPEIMTNQSEFVRQNAGEHGYGCACLKMKVDSERHRVLEVSSAHQELLKTCLEDPDLTLMPKGG